jgi:hypothetical protein
LLVEIHYVGDAARLYLGDKLFLDNYYNGDSFAIPLWRIPREEWSKLRLEILPFSEALMGRLPEQAKQKVAEAKAAGTLNKVSVTTTAQLEDQLTPL